jgi:8-oxo-dGTP pyrophosphatase MutT (NUDIX family)
VAHYAVPVKPAPAATLALLRDARGGGCEVLLIRRHDASRFAGGDFVFPGGKVEPDDNPADAARHCAGLDESAAAARLGLADDRRTALAYWIGAIRETFEEVGLLLAYGADGALARLPPDRLVRWRRACHADNRVFWEMVDAEGLTPATDRLVYFAHWITPESQPLRFDTRFFAAPAPEGQAATADAREITEVRWLVPAEALAAGRRGELSLRLPTQKNLALLDGASGVAAALARLRARPAPPTITPRIVMEGGRRRVLLPGEPGY